MVEITGNEKVIVCTLGSKVLDLTLYVIIERSGITCDLLG